MAKYTLQNDWYAPDGTYFPASRVDGVEIPEHLVKHLPKNSAKPHDPASAAQVRGVTTQDVFAQQEQRAPVSRDPAVADEPVLTADAAIALAAAGQSAEAAQVTQVTQVTQPAVAKKPGRRA